MNQAHVFNPYGRERLSMYQFFWSAYHRWRADRNNVVFPPLKIAGKEPDLNKLFLLVGAKGGAKTVSFLYANSGAS